MVIRHCFKNSESTPSGSLQLQLQMRFGSRPSKGGQWRQSGNELSGEFYFGIIEFSANKHYTVTTIQTAFGITVTQGKQSLHKKRTRHFFQRVTFSMKGPSTTCSLFVHRSRAIRFCQLLVGFILLFVQVKLIAKLNWIYKMVTSTENVSSEEMDKKIVAQVEYYFGDLNLKQDKFMKFHIGQNEGWFPLEKLMTFNRLKNLTTDQEAVVNCIKNATSDLVELSEDGSKIRRTKPVPEESEEYIKDLNQRTLHLKGFPKDSVLDDIMQFCSEYGKVDSIQMRRNFKKNGEFKGCIMVVYSIKEDADKVLDSSDLKYKEIELLKENKEKYLERKKAFYDSLKKKKGENAGGDSGFVKTKGAILKITGINKDTKFGEIKEELSKHSKVAFVSNVNDQLECHVRFAVEDGAKEALAALKGQAEVKSEETDKVSIELFGQKVDISLVSEEEEKEFWREFQSKQFNGNKGKNKWQRGKKRFNNDNGGSRNKHARTRD